MAERQPDALQLIGSLIRDVPDFPKPGIMFKDITPLLRDATGLSMAMDAIAQPFIGAGVDIVGGAESRGFIFAMAVAAKLSAGFVPFRKPGRLPRETRREEYRLEYGSNALEVHRDAVKPGDRVLLVDDLLATGGTMRACCDLVNGLGGEVVGTSFLIELKFLGGRAKLDGYAVRSVLAYD
jgi:adenine phosphoribosyltransferase